MTTKIYWRNGFINVNPDDSPRDTRQLDSFLVYNNVPKCFMKVQGGWYKILKDGTMLFVSRTLYLLSFKEWLEVAKSENTFPFAIRN